MTDQALIPFGWSLAQAGQPTRFYKGTAPADGATAYADEASYNAGIEAVRNPPLTLAGAQALQASILNGGCAVAITGGYTSSALGAPHLYGSKTTDQANLDADMMAAATNSSVTAEIACSADGGTAWSVVAHTAAQIATLWGDFRAWRIAQQTKNRGLQAQVAAAATVEAVQAIVWS